MTLPVVLGAIALKLATDLALDYLYPDSVADGTLPTSPILANPPPFLGGQMVGVRYKIEISYVTAAGVTRYTTGAVLESTLTSQSDAFIRNAIQPVITGAISGITIQTSVAAPFTNYVVLIKGASTGTGVSQDSRFPNTFVNPATIKLNKVVRFENLPDTGGNLPTSGNPDIASGAAPQNPTLAITPSDNLVEAGLPVIALPSILPVLLGLAAQIGSAIAAAQAAADTLTAIKAVADATKKVADMIDANKDIFDKLRLYLNQKEKEEAAKKQYFIRQYGTILRDGYLDITPRPAPVGFNPLMLDFQCSNIPNGIGRFFGKDSYNWFRYQELGSICFLSPTAGVLSIHKIEHVRTSIAIPALAVGFTYNMGLNGTIRARVSMLYTREKP